jgi:hypothetical protein
MSTDIIATRAYRFTIGKFNAANKYRVVGRHRGDPPWYTVDPETEI